MAAGSLVLLVHPSADVCDALGRALRAHGYRIISALTGRAAIRYLGTVRPDAIISEGEMADLPGREMQTLLRALCPQAVRLVFASRHPADAPTLDIDEDATVRLPHDVDAATLVGRLQQSLEGRGPSATQGSPAEGDAAPRRLARVCAWCGSVRDEAGIWQKIGLGGRGAGTDRFTHGICPDCLRREEAALLTARPI